MPKFEIVLALVAAVALLAAIGRRISVANPIMFALGGLALALVPGMPEVQMPPGIVLTVFLPPLIYAAAQDTSWAEMRQHARPILFLAVGLVLATMSAVAVVFHAIVPTMPWAVAFTLGAIVGPPDAVAAKSIADTLNLPRRVVAVLEGEGLVNDATALVAFHVASAVVIAGTRFDPGSAALSFGYSVITSPLIGMAIGLLGLKIIRPISDPATENTILLLLPFGTYLLAEHVNASGVLAVLALALILTEYTNKSVSAAGRLLGRAFWEMLDFLLTGLSFVLIGLQLRSVIGDLAAHPRHQVAWVTVAVCATVVLVRPLWVFLVATLSYRLRGSLLGSNEEAPTKAGLKLVSWAGMRGVISLAIALSLPQNLDSGRPFPGRGLIIFVTFAVIFVTLVGQGLTLPALINRLGIRANTTSQKEQILAARVRMIRAAYEAAASIGEKEGFSDTVIERARDYFGDSLATLENEQEQAGTDGAKESAAEEAELQKLLRILLKVAQEELLTMRNEGEIEAPLARNLLRDLDVKRAGKKRLH